MIEFRWQKGKAPRDVVKRLPPIYDRVTQAVGWGIFAGLNSIVSLSKDLSPTRSGTMDATHYVTPPTRETGTSMRAEAGVGGGPAPYTLIVHEDQDPFFERATMQGLGQARSAAHAAAVAFYKSGSTPPGIHATHPDNAEARARSGGLNTVVKGRRG